MERQRSAWRRLLIGPREDSFRADLVGAVWFLVGVGIGMVVLGGDVGLLVGSAIGLTFGLGRRALRRRGR